MNEPICNLETLETIENDAKIEAQYWIGICKNYDPSSKVSIVKTNKPRKIR